MKVAIIYYSTWGHMQTLVEKAQKSITSKGGEADIYQISETLPREVLEKMYAAPKPSYPEATVDILTKYDGFIFGVPTRYGNLPAQWKAFWDQTGGLWTLGGLVGKPFTIMVSTGGQGGGQEITIRNSLSSFVHHGMIYIPLGYSGGSFPLLTNLDEVHGGSSWGAGAFAGPDGSRSPSELELEIVNVHASEFVEKAEKFCSSLKTEPAKDVKETVKETGKEAAGSKPANDAKKGAEAKANDTKEKSGCCIVM